MYRMICNFMIAYWNLALWQLDNGQKPIILYIFFHSGCHKTKFSALFWMLPLGKISCSFAFVLVYISQIQGWRVKLTSSIKILVLWHQEMEFRDIQKTKKILKPRIQYDYQVFVTNSLNVYSNDILYLSYPIFKPVHQIVDFKIPHTGDKESLDRCG